MRKKRINNLRIIAFIGLLIIVFQVQSQDAKLIYGTWETIPEEKQDDQTSIIGSSNKQAVFRLTFKQNGMVYNHSTEAEFSYELEEDMLYMGNEVFEVLELLQGQMTLKREEDEFSLEEEILKFKKIEI